MKKALVCGAGGFIGNHLVKRLKADGYWVRGVDIKEQEYEKSQADEFRILDLRLEKGCRAAMLTNTVDSTEFDEVYQLAADMGGMGFIHNEECDIMRNSSLININMSEMAIRKYKVKNYLFASSACVYRDQEVGENELSESDAYPAFPDNEYGWEKLYAERMAMTFGKHSGTNVRIARFQNCYGPYGTWKGGREKAPAALYVDDLVDGICRLMHSDIEGGVNIGRQEYVSVDELAQTIAKVAGKKININHIDGPVGVKARYFTNDVIESTGWKSKYSLEDGIKETYKWIKERVEDV
jgi:nucleoside-diphosphate-sugar epimerase